MVWEQLTVNTDKVEIFLRKTHANVLSADPLWRGQQRHPADRVAVGRRAVQAAHLPVAGADGADADREIRHQGRTLRPWVNI